MSCPSVFRAAFTFGATLTDTLLVLTGSGRERPEPEFARDVVKLLDQFAGSSDGRPTLEAGRQALVEFGKIPSLLNWDQGLRQAFYDLTLKTVIEAERFRGHNSTLKRRFAVDLISRVLREYEPSPLFELVEDVSIKPFVGVLVDWTVEVLNVHDAWPPVTHVKIPGFYSGQYGVLLRLMSWIWRLISAAGSALIWPSAYERHLRDALRKAGPEIHSLHTALPPAAQQQNLEQIATIFAKVAKLTAPHVRLAISLLKLAARIANESPEKRRELAGAVFRILLERAFADNWIILEFLKSSGGDFLISELVRSTDWVLARNGLLPLSEGDPAPIYAVSA